MTKAQRVLIVVGLIGIVIFASFGYFYKAEIAKLALTTGVTHEVVLTSEGFTPRSLTVKVGDEVVFKSQKGVEFWPASNQHPIHAAYPAFDSKMPIQSDALWSFQFTQVGTWAYHDHLNSPLRGEVVVIP